MIWKKEIERYEDKCTMKGAFLHGESVYRCSTLIIKPKELKNSNFQICNLWLRLVGPELKIKRFCDGLVKD